MNYDFERARKILIKDAEISIKRFKDKLEAGTREWDEMQKEYFNYVELIKISDLLCEIDLGNYKVIGKDKELIIDESLKFK